MAPLDEAKFLESLEKSTKVPLRVFESRSSTILAKEKPYPS
jgi:hypothetical protein